MITTEPSWGAQPWLPGFLIRRQNDTARLVIATCVTSVLPIVALNLVAVLAGVLSRERFGRLPNWPIGSPEANFAMGMVDVLLLTPLVETGLILIPLRLFRAIRVPEQWLPLVVGLVWGLYHYYFTGHYVGLLHMWSFYLLTAILMLFEKQSLDRAWLIASSVHVAHNACALSLGFLIASL